MGNGQWAMGNGQWVIEEGKRGGCAVRQYGLGVSPSRVTAYLRSDLLPWR